eukprot:7389238-Prymnesium_polylepis.3
MHTLPWRAQTSFTAFGPASGLASPSKLGSCALAQVLVPTDLHARWACVGAAATRIGEAAARADDRAQRGAVSSG